MTLATEICKKQCIRTEWHVYAPIVDRRVESPPLSLETNEWKFTLNREISGFAQDTFRINFVQYKLNAMPGVFQLTSHIISKVGYQYVSCREIDCMYNEVNIYEGSLYDDYPEIDFTQKLKFAFTFECGIRSFPDYRFEHKFVQTSAYFDDRRCLESLSLDLRKLVDEESPDPDVRLKCGECTLPAHRFILGARSEVFRSMLKNDMKEGRDRFVEIVNMEPEIFQTFITYLYTGVLPELSVDVALPLFEAGDKYNVEALRGRCSDFLANHPTREKACEILAVADAHSDEDLKERVISYMLEENIPKDEDMWPKFCDSHLQLAFEVLTVAYRQSICFQ